MSAGAPTAARSSSPSIDAAPLLTASGVEKRFGGLVSVHDVTFHVPARSVVSLIGPNGAGKTTFFNLLTGLYAPTSGRILIDGKDFTGARPDQITKHGVARTFQNIRLFGAMTALDNVVVGRHARMGAGIFGSIFRTPKVRREEDEVRERARDLLLYVGLQPGQVDRVATHLAYGDQRRVEIARALASEPRVLLLDEPTAGMNPSESDELTALVRRLRDEKDLSVLLIEHDMKVVMEVSERITVLDHGEKIAEAEPVAIRSDPKVVEAYLGTQA